MGLSARSDRAGVPRVTQQPLVTVIIPTFDRHDFLGKAIESVLAQDYPNVECLVIDDGSTDETPSLLAAYGGRITTVRQENRGVCGAVNRGFEAASGEFVSILNSDDELYPWATSATVAALVANPGASAAHGIVQVTSITGDPIFRYSVGDTNLADSLRYHLGPSTTGLMCRRTTALDLGGWNPRYRSGFDYDMWLRLGLVGDYVFVRKVLGTFVQHPGSITVSHDPGLTAKDYLAVVEDFLARPDLPSWTEDLRAEVLRTVYYAAGVVVGGTVNQPGERFTISDLVSARLTAWDDVEA